MTKPKKPVSVHDSDGEHLNENDADETYLLINLYLCHFTSPLANVVLQYLRKTNRPFNTTDIHTNLNGALTKASVTKALDKLTEQDLAFSKTYGKSVIYSIVQDDEDDVSPEELGQLDSQIDKLTKKLKELKETNIIKVNELKKLNSTLRTSEARDQLSQMQQQNSATNERLSQLRSDKDQISSEDKSRIEKEYDTNFRLWRTRKKLFNDIFKTVTEHLPGKLSDFKDELGIDDDPVPMESLLVD